MHPIGNWQTPILISLVLAQIVVERLPEIFCILILFFVTAHNSLSQRLYTLLSARKLPACLAKASSGEQPTQVSFDVYSESFSLALTYRRSRICN
ncbi:hypothetical protein BDZ89DRAFT_1075155 [Hymenopellis radicata]|nr:hypothetical protein BDZ89DRAFT_1075155 [Hymenopellis radicata]